MESFILQKRRAVEAPWRIAALCGGPDVTIAVEIVVRIVKNLNIPRAEGPVVGDQNSCSGKLPDQEQFTVAEPENEETGGASSLTGRVGWRLDSQEQLFHIVAIEICRRHCGARSLKRGDFGRGVFKQGQRARGIRSRRNGGEIKGFCGTGLTGEKQNDSRADRSPYHPNYDWIPHGLYANVGMYFTPARSLYSAVFQEKMSALSEWGRYDFSSVLRLSVVGISGCGKSVCARRLAACTGLPLYHMDTLFWGPGWTEKPESQWRPEEQALIAQNLWIIEGYIDSQSEERIRRSSLVLYLDFSGPVCALNGVRRWWRHREESRPEIPGCPERFSLSFLWTMLCRKERQEIEKTLSCVPESRVLRLTSPKDLDGFLKNFEVKAVQHFEFQPNP